MEDPQINEQLNFEKVWFLFQNTDKKFQETNKKFQETDKLLTEKFQETDKKFQETDKLLTEKFQETDKKFQETDKKFQETDKKIKALSNLFTTQWGKLIESLVEPACLKLFQERGIKISRTTTNVKVKREEEETEYDILLINDTEIVIIEVKTTFRREALEEFIEKLKKFKHFAPEYRNYKVYGAIAAIRYDEGTDRLAYRQGLFVIKSSGENILKIANNIKFKPFIF